MAPVERMPSLASLWHVLMTLRALRHCLAGCQDGDEVERRPAAIKMSAPYSISFAAIGAKTRGN
jgi:hypothetical protein